MCKEEADCSVSLPLSVRSSSFEIEGLEEEGMFFLLFPFSLVSDWDSSMEAEFCVSVSSNKIQSTGRTFSPEELVVKLKELLGGSLS